MPIKVRFDKNGFYHPAYGRLGRGKNEGRVYTLPDAFGAKETIEVPIMDNTHKPPRETGEVKTITRYKNIPSSAEVIDDGYIAELQAASEQGDEDAHEELEAIKASRMPKVATQEQLDKVTGRGKTAKAQDAQERTTGKKRRARKASTVE